jgi:trigger factor
MIMQLDIKDIDSVSKEATVTLTTGEVSSAFATVYNQIGQRVSLPGFRRGKVPVGHLRKKFARDAASEVLQVLVEKGWRGVLEDGNILPLSEPKFDLSPVVEGKGYTFSMTIEVPPVFEVKDFDTLSVEREVWTASDDVVANELSHLAENFATYEPVDGRAVTEANDSIVFDYAGKVEDVAFEGGTAEGASLILGSNQFIPGFEEQCVGQKVGETFDVTVTFPEDYQSTDLAGKEAVFTCTVSEIRSKVVPEIGPVLAERVGEPDLETLTSKVKESVEAQSNDNSLIQTREELRIQLGGQYDFDVPASLIESSLSERRSRAVNAAVRDGKDVADAEKEFDAQEGVLDEVKSSMRAMFVLDDVARSEEIEVTPFDVHQEVEKLAATMGPYAHQFRQMYQDADRRALLTRRLKHDKVLDFILTKANVTDIAKDVPKHEEGEQTGEDDA